MDANSGRTIHTSSGSYLALQVTLGSGQRGGSTEAQGGHFVGGGHSTTGQRGRGQGGQSPILQGLLQVVMQGGQGGTADFRIYLDMSGGAGHSVLSMYLDMSGWGGQGGIEAFRTYLDQSIWGQRLRSSLLHLQPSPRPPQSAQGRQPQLERGRRQTSQVVWVTSTKPSPTRPLRTNTNPRITPTMRAPI